jgi:hypothetical protein
MAVVRELFAVLGINVDGASFKQADRALANIHHAIQRTQAATAKAGDAAAPVADGASASAAAGLAAVKGFAGAVLSLAAKVTNAFRDIFVQFQSLNSEIGKAQRQFGGSAQEFFGLSKAVGLAGVSGEELSSTLGNIQAQMYATTTGSAEAVMAFSRLGISIRKTGGGFKSATDVFDEAVVKLSQIEDPVIRTGKALATVGQAGLDVANMIRDRGLPAFQEFRQAAKDAAPSEQDRAALREYGYEQAKLGLLGQKFRNAVGGPIAQVLADVSKRFNEWLKLQKDDGPEALRESVAGIGKLSDGFLKLLQLGYKFATGALPVLVEWLTSLANIVQTVALGLRDGLIFYLEKFGDVGVAVAVALLAYFFPIQTLLVALGILIEDLIVFAKGGDSLTGRALEAFKQWREEFFKPSDNEPLWIKAIRWVLDVFVNQLPAAIRDLAAVVKGLLTEAFKGLKQTVDGLTQPVKEVVDKIRFAFHRANVATAEGLNRIGAPGVAQDFFGGEGFSDARRRGVAASTLGVYARPLDANVPQVVSVAPPVPTVPVSPYAPGAHPRDVNFNVTIDARGGLNRKEIVEQLKPELESFWEEQLVTKVLRPAQP